MRKVRSLSALPNVRHAFYNRNGGVSKGAFASLNTSLLVGDERGAVFENRKRVCAQIGVDETHLFLPKQVHGDVIVRVVADSQQTNIEQTEGDAIWTNVPGVVVGVQTADCAPLLLADKRGIAVMAVHLGWRGAANGLAKKAVECFVRETGVSTRDIVASIGPCIGFESFEVGPEVVDALRAQVASEGLVRKRDATHFEVDLEGWIERLLQNAGLIEIDRLRECTFLSPDRYFSFRRDKGQTGRQVSVITKILK